MTCAAGCLFDLIKNRLLFPWVSQMFNPNFVPCVFAFQQFEFKLFEMFKNLNFSIQNLLTLTIRVNKGHRKFEELKSVAKKNQSFNFINMQR